MQSITDELNQLIQYGLKTEILDPRDRVYAVNRLIDVLKFGGFSELPPTGEVDFPEDPASALEHILSVLCDYAYESGLIAVNNVTHRDMFDTRLMGCLTPQPSVVIDRFRKNYGISARHATDHFYKFSQDTDYIRRYRTVRDMKWVTKTEYGEIDISINLAKPEKDPRDIAAALNDRKSDYPKCLLCREAEGFAGSPNCPARQNHRMIPIKLDEEDWFFQYSPYVYYNEHCIALNREHIPMKIDQSTFRKLADFIDLFPHYFIGSNADLPIVGGSILTHDHFQGGHYEFAMARAPIADHVLFPSWPNVKAGTLKWPLSVIRLVSQDKNTLIALANVILEKWRTYSDQEAFIFAETGGTPHNTVTPIMRKRNDLYELDLALRNNLATKEHPLGVFHPHAELHHIKKENIGLIEVMGLAVLPARLVREMDILKEYLLLGQDVRSVPEIAHHADWTDRILAKYGRIAEGEVDTILKDEIGAVFVRVLEDAGVFKQNEQGQAAFGRFIRSVGGTMSQQA